MGYGFIELKCPQGHVWNIEWCSVGGFRIGPTKCSVCGEEGKSTQRNVLAEAKAEAENKWRSRTI